MILGGRWPEVLMRKSLFPNQRVGLNRPSPQRRVRRTRKDVAILLDFDNLFMAYEQLPNESIDVGRIRRLAQMHGRVIFAYIFTSRLVPTYRDPEEEARMDAAVRDQSLLDRNKAIREFVSDGFDTIILPAREKGDDVDNAMSRTANILASVVPTLGTLILGSHDHGFQFVANQIHQLFPPIRILAFVVDPTKSGQLASSADGFLNIRSPFLRKIVPLIGQPPDTITARLSEDPDFQEVRTVISCLAPILRQMASEVDYMGNLTFIRNWAWPHHDFPRDMASREDTLGLLKLLAASDAIHYDREIAGNGARPKRQYIVDFSHPLLK